MVPRKIFLYDIAYKCCYAFIILWKTKAEENKNKLVKHYKKRYTCNIFMNIKYFISKEFDKIFSL